MAKTREIKGRLKAVANIKRITKTMQMIATSKFQQALRRATATKPFTDKVAELVGDLAGAAGGEGESGGISHPLLTAPKPATGRELLLVITSNRGLCGGYNANVLRESSQYIRGFAGEQLDLEVAGRKGIAYCKFAGFNVTQPHTNLGDNPAFDQVDAIATSYIDRFAAGQYDQVQVAYMKFVSNARQEAVIERLLPLQRPAASEDESQDGASVQYDFSPDPAELLAELLPITVKTRLFQFFNDAVVSEQIARMVAMKAATDNADDMGRRLRRQFNRARQTQITTELNEVVSGAEALN